MIRAFVCFFACCCLAFGQASNSGRISGTGTQLFVTNGQTSTYQVIPSDFEFCKTIPVASGTFTITLIASTSQPANGECLWIINYGSGTVTVSPSGQDINGSSSSISVGAGFGLFVVSDGTNYEAQKTTSSGGGVTSFSGDGNIITNMSSTGAVTVTIAGTSGGIPYFYSSSAWMSSSVLASTALVVGGGTGGAPTTGNGDFTYATHTLAGGASALFSMASATGANAFKIQAQAGATCSAAGCMNEDTTATMYHNYTGGADSLVATVPAATSVTNLHCVEWSVSGSVKTLADLGAACLTSTTAVTSFSGDGNIITNSSSTGTVTVTIAGTSGGIPYFYSSSAWKSSAVLSANELMIGGGAGAAPTVISQTSYSSPTVTYTITSLASTPSDAFIYANTTAATSSQTQVSPSVHHEGFGWGTTAGASQQTDVLIYNTPVQDTTADPFLTIATQDGSRPGSYTVQAYIGPQISGHGNPTIYLGSSTPNANNYVLSLQGSTLYLGGASSSFNFRSSGGSIGTLTGTAFGPTGAVQPQQANAELCGPGGGVISIYTNTSCGTTAANYRDIGLRSVISYGATPSISGCSAGTQIGGATAGTFVSGTTGVCTVTLTFATTAPNGWAITGADVTTTTDTVLQTAYTTTTATIAGTTVSGDVIVWQARAF